MGALDEPFPGSWAMAAGLVSRWVLRHNFVRVFPDVYLRKGCPLDARGRARAAAHWAKGDGALIGYSAAALHGTRWLDPEAPAHIARMGHCKPPSGIRVLQAVIDPGECCEVDGFRVTTPARTAFDLGRQLPRDEAVAVIDALCAATGLAPSEIETVARTHPGDRGVTRLWTIIDLVDGGAESPPESHTRLLLIDAGLPRPTTQLVARVNATLLRHRPHIILDRVRTALHAQGWTDDQQELVAVSVDREADCIDSW